MITVDFCRTLAQYNSWQNRALIAAADQLDDAARAADHGAFFTSISGTLNHLLWGDTIWMARLDGWDNPGGNIAQSPHFTPNWADYKSARNKADQRIKHWAATLTTAALSGDLSWFSQAANAQVQRPKALCVMHFFNHQTHHRGQVHAMLTKSGAATSDTDLFLLPEAMR